MSVAAANSQATSRFWARSVGSLAVTVALCTLLFRRVDSGDLLDWLLRVDRRYFVGYVVLSIVGLLVRSARYYLLIGRWVGFVPLVLVTAARNFLVDLLPARIGSLSYVYLLTRRFEAPLGPVATSVFAAFVVAAFLGLSPALRWSAERLARFPRAADVARRFAQVAAEVDESGGAGTTLALLGVSLVIRLLKFGAYWLLLLGVVREHDVTAAELPFWTAFLGIAGAELSATLPIHGIGGFGTYETAWTIGFRQLGLSSRVAILSGFATHLLSQLYDYTVGLVGLATALAWSRRAR